MVVPILMHYLTFFIKIKAVKCIALCLQPAAASCIKSQLMKCDVMQGCGNTMPDLPDMVPFHSGLVKNSYLVVLGQV